MRNTSTTAAAPATALQTLFETSPPPEHCMDDDEDDPAGGGGGDLLTTRLRLVLPHVMMGYIIIVCLCGIVGNALSLTLIWNNERLKRISSNLHLTCMAVSASIFLGCLLTAMVDGLLPIAIYSSKMGCKILTFCTHTSDFMCNWSIALLSVDRAVIVHRPSVWRAYGTAATMRCSVLCLLLAGCALNAYILFVATTHEPLGDCSIFASMQNVYNIMQFTDTVVGFVVPTLLIVVLNASTIHKYNVYTSKRYSVRFHAKLDHMLDSGEHGADNEHVILNPSTQNTPLAQFTTSTKKSSSNAHNHASPVMVGGGHHHHQQQTNGVVRNGSRRGEGQTTSLRQPVGASDLKLTGILLTITTLFVVFNTPHYLVRIYRYHLGDASDALESNALYLLGQSLAYALYYLHYLLLFYLYIFWSPSLKLQLKYTVISCIECHCMKPVPDM